MFRTPLNFFANVDQAPDPKEMLHFLEKVSDAPWVRSRNQQRLMTSGIQPGARICEFGCGIGSDSFMLAEHVGKLGQVIGVDCSQEMLTHASRRATERGLSNITFYRGNIAQPLDFLEDQSFDACWIERVLLYVSNPLDVFTQMYRVLRPGGRVVVMEPDMAGILIDGSPPEISELVIKRWVTEFQNPDIARRLARMAHNAGFTAVQVETELVLCPWEATPFTERWRAILDELINDGVIAPPRAEAWWEDLYEQATKNGTVCAMPAFTVQAVV